MPEPSPFAWPAWLEALHPRAAVVGDTDQLALAIRCAETSCDNGGGPFGAAVFDGAGTCLAVGANLVTVLGASILHAEIVALTRAQRAVAHHDLRRANSPVTLATSSEPCAMCFGALPWAGLDRMVYGAPAREAEAVGFDEGPKARTWKRALRSRGIEVVGPRLEARARAVLQRYGDSGGIIY